VSCASFRLHIGYDRDRRHAVMEWDGPWAVAEALAEADREDGRFVWRNEDPPVEIRMDVRGRLRLLEVMKAARADPASRPLDEWLPKLAVEVR
jgi:hypothetical protein